MKKVLVTGANGFIGRHVCKYLSKQNLEIYGIGHGYWDDEGYQAWGISSWYSCDVNLENLNNIKFQPDLIIHCCGTGTVSISESDPWSDYNKNVNSLVSVLNYIALYEKKPKLVMLSSAAVYGDVIDLPIVESSSENPKSIYGVHKVIAENVCKQYSLFHKIPSSIIRLFSVYGHGLKKQLLWDASIKINKGIYDFFGTGKEIRDFIHIDDVAALIPYAANSADINTVVMNGGSGQGLSIKTIIDKLLVNYKSEVKDIVFSGKIRAYDPPGYIAEISYAKSLGWNPVVNIDDGLNNYCEWFKKQKK